jgi:hypothetical protein
MLTCSVQCLVEPDFATQNALSRSDVGCATEAYLYESVTATATQSRPRVSDLRARGNAGAAERRQQPATNPPVQVRPLSASRVGNANNRVSTQGLRATLRTAFARWLPSTRDDC